MSVVKINVVTLPEDKRERFEERFRGRSGAVETTPGFEWFELLRPVEGTDAYLVYTRWESEEAYSSWQSSQELRRRGHPGAGGRALAEPPVELRGRPVLRPARREELTGGPRPAARARQAVAGRGLV